VAGTTPRPGGRRQTSLHTSGGTSKKKAKTAGCGVDGGAKRGVGGGRGGKKDDAWKGTHKNILGGGKPWKGVALFRRLAQA